MMSNLEALPMVLARFVRSPSGVDALDVHLWKGLAPLRYYVDFV